MTKRKWLTSVGEGTAYVSYGTYKAKGNIQFSDGYFVLSNGCETITMSFDVYDKQVQKAGVKTLNTLIDSLEDLREDYLDLIEYVEADDIKKEIEAKATQESVTNG